MKKIIFICGVIGALLFVIASILGGMQLEGYSPISQYISESYATGIPNSENLQYAYMTSGILLTLFGFLAPSTFPKSKGIRIGFLLFAFFYGLGTIVTGFFPCDLGCPTESADLSISQFIHNTLGFLTYSVIPFCLIGLGISFRKFPRTKKLGRFSLACGILSLTFVLLLFANPTGPYIGLFQRIIEGGILFWIFYCSFFILRNTNPIKS